MKFNHAKLSAHAGVVLVFLSVAVSSQMAFADENLLSPDKLSFLEKPMAIQFGEATLSMRGSLDQGVRADLNSGELNPNTAINFEFSTETKLRNQLTVGAIYSVHYTTNPGSITDSGGGKKSLRHSYTTGAFVSGIWGKALAGNVNNIVDQETTRKKNVGNAALAYEKNLGGLNDWGVGYTGRFGPAVISAAVDDDSNIDAGIRFSRPLGNKDFGLAVRGTLGQFTSQDTTATFDTANLGVNADVIYGSSLFDMGIGIEVLSFAGTDIERYYGSLGLQHKLGALTVSLSGHYGQLNNHDEFSAALGAQYDIARGLSLNAGINYAKLAADLGNINIVSKDELEAITSLRYEF